MFKLSPWYMGSYEIMKYVGEVAYKLDLPNYLAPVHLVFHVSLLTMCIGDRVSIIRLQCLEVDENFLMKRF